MGGSQHRDHESLDTRQVYRSGHDHFVPNISKASTITVRRHAVSNLRPSLNEILCTANAAVSYETGHKTHVGVGVVGIRNLGSSLTFTVRPLCTSVCSGQEVR